MLSHDFQDMPSRDGSDATEGLTEGLTSMVLRCRHCFKTPAKAREDGCAARELAENGIILLSLFNPGGVVHFHGRNCVTCDGPIMGHFLRRNSNHYWCTEGGPQVSEGVTDCQFDVEGVTVPQEPTSDMSDPKWDE